MEAVTINRWFVLLIGIILTLSVSAIAQPTVQTGIVEYEISLADLIGEEAAQEYSDEFEPDTPIKWSLYVPKNYSSETPPGIFVFVSPIKDGTIRRKWKRVFDARNMIYISAIGDGNFVSSKRRYYNSVFATLVARRLYETDNRVTIVSGFSGGGRMSTRILEFVPQIFTGGLMIGGSYNWQGDIEDLEPKLRGGAYVFLAGDRDHAEWETENAYRQYKNAGLENVKFISVRGLGHSFPNWREMDEALEYINETLRN